jgi:hypothetical protein
MLKTARNRATSATSLIVNDLARNTISYKPVTCYCFCLDLAKFDHPRRVLGLVCLASPGVFSEKLLALQAPRLVEQDFQEDTRKDSPKPLSDTTARPCIVHMLKKHMS